MKRITISILVLLYSVTGALYAQSNSVLNRLYQKMAGSAVSMDFSYVLNMSGTRTIGDGTILLQDGAYVMKGNGLQINCDMQNVWVIDAAGKEVILETAAQGEQSYLENPALLLANLTETFNVDKSSVSGSVYTYCLSPKVSCGVTDAKVSISTSPDPIIDSASFTLSDGGELDIKIKSMTFSEKKPLTSFYYDISLLDSSWLITDLR